MKRSLWKLPYISKNLFDKRKISTKRSLNLTDFRASTIPAYFVGKKVCIYNGAWLLTKNIDERMVGLKIGEFSVSKRFDKQLQKKKTRVKRKPKKN